jgi:flagellar motor protein MotB
MRPNNRAVSPRASIDGGEPAAIVAQGIAKDWLTSAGYGPDKPVGDNATADGRTQNRRVELVKS